MELSVAILSDSEHVIFLHFIGFKSPSFVSFELLFSGIGTNMELSVVSLIEFLDDLDSDKATRNVGIDHSLDVATIDFGEGDDLVVLRVVVMDELVDEFLAVFVCLLLHRKVLIEENLPLALFTQCPFKSIPQLLIHHACQLTLILQI